MQDQIARLFSHYARPRYCFAADRVNRLANARPRWRSVGISLRQGRRLWADDGSFALYDSRGTQW